MNACRIRKLALGGAQFGMRYGIANTSGQPPNAAVDQILRRANEFGISMIDTAEAYGDSEAILGRLVGHNAHIRIVTKTHPIRTDFVEQDHVKSVIDAFDASLRRLDRGTVYGLLVHDARDLLAPGGERLWAW